MTVTITCTDDTSYRRDLIRALLILAAKDESKKQQPTARFLNHATDLIVGRVWEAGDPMVRIATDLEALMASVRAGVTDEAYGEVVSAFERIADLLPDEVTVARPAPRLRSVLDTPDPQDLP